MNSRVTLYNHSSTMMNSRVTLYNHSSTMMNSRVTLYNRLHVNPLARNQEQVKLDSDEWKLWKNLFEYIELFSIFGFRASTGVNIAFHFKTIYNEKWMKLLSILRVQFIYI
jgi:hypothetical protein